MPAGKVGSRKGKQGVQFPSAWETHESSRLRTRNSEAQRAWEGRAWPWWALSPGAALSPSHCSFFLGSDQGPHSSARGRIGTCPWPRSTPPSRRPVRTAPWKLGAGVGGGGRHLLWERAHLGWEPGAVTCNGVTVGSVLTWERDRASFSRSRRKRAGACPPGATGPRRALRSPSGSLGSKIGNIGV